MPFFFEALDKEEDKQVVEMFEDVTENFVQKKLRINPKKCQLMSDFTRMVEEKAPKIHTANMTVRVKHNKETIVELFPTLDVRVEGRTYHVSGVSVWVTRKQMKKLRRFC